MNGARDLKSRDGSTFPIIIYIENRNSEAYTLGTTMSTTTPTGLWRIFFNRLYSSSTIVLVLWLIVDSKIFNKSQSCVRKLESLHTDERCTHGTHDTHNFFSQNPFHISSTYKSFQSIFELSANPLKYGQNHSIIWIRDISVQHQSISIHRQYQVVKTLQHAYLLSFRLRPPWINDISWFFAS